MSSFIQNQFEQNIVTTSVDHVFNWARKSAIWPLTFGLACCAIEMIAASTSRFDIARFGAEVFRPSPRQSDLMIVAGTVTLKMAPVLKRIWDQMPDPKWCISMGACSSVGGPFNTYAVLQGVDKIVPVDVYVTGCPPRPENLFYALLKLQDKIDQMTTLVKRPTEVRLDETMLERVQAADPHRADPEPRHNSCSIGTPTDSTASPNSTRFRGWSTASARATADIPALFAQLATLKQIHSSTCVAGRRPRRHTRRRRRPARKHAGLRGRRQDRRLHPRPAGRRTPSRRRRGPRRMARHRRPGSWPRAVAAMARALRHTRRGSARRHRTRHRKVLLRGGPGGRGSSSEGREEGHIDLTAANRRQLDEAGVTHRPHLRVESCAPCAGTGEFHSFRRDKEAAGRLYSFAGITLSRYLIA